MRKISGYINVPSPEPTIPDPFYIAPGITPIVLDITSGTVQRVQQQIDNTRAANPDSYIVINLTGTYEVLDNPLTLRSKEILYLNGTLKMRFYNDTCIIINLYTARTVFCRYNG